MDIEKIVAVYVKIRDEKSRIKKEADARCAEAGEGRATQ